MNTNPDNHKAQLTEIAKAVGAILGVPLALFAIVNSIFAQPLISLVVALITAVLVSVWVILSRWISITEIITAWLALAVVILAGFVIWPRTMTVKGFVYDTARNPVSNEEVVFFDRSGRRYETKTNAEGYYQFIDVPSGKYGVQVRTNEIEGETKGILVRVVQQNLTVPEISATESPTSVAAVISNTPTATPTLTSTSTPTSTLPPTDTPTPMPPTATPVPVSPTDTPMPVPSTDTPTPSAPPPRMVYVPAGEFIMGSDEGDSEEQPVHTVYLDAFYIDKTEVTNAQFAAFVSATGYAPDAEQKGCAWICEGDGWDCIQGVDWQHPFGPDTDLAGKDEHPVVQVSWNDAKAYCEWAGARLPTEVEWEKAARGTDGLIYPWGNTFDGTKLNFADKNTSFDWSDSNWDDGYADTAPVGSYPDGASPYGALDMAGNVWEWVADWYDSGYYAASPESNPEGPASGDYRVLRGGSWVSNAGSVRAATRGRGYPDGSNLNVGFRCAR